MSQINCVPDDTPDPPPEPNPYGATEYQKHVIKECNEATAAATVFLNILKRAGAQFSVTDEWVACSLQKFNPDGTPGDSRTFLFSRIPVPQEGCWPGDIDKKYLKQE